MKKTRQTVIMHQPRKRKSKGRARNKRNGMEKRAAMNTLAKSMNRGFGN